MKRDDDFIRALLFEAESSDQDLMIFEDLSPTLEDEKRKVHTLLLCDSGFFARNGQYRYRITNQGHDYLAVIRDDTIWKKTKEGAAKLGGGTLGMMRDLALALAKQRIADLTGLSF
jgi:hypothetical protein